jgi:hypothetical protein
VSTIGVLNEKPLHLALKTAYARPGDQLEARVGRYVVDILRGDQVIEIQTRNVAAIRRKLVSLVTDHDVLLVLPIAARTSIVRVMADGAASAPRTSPKREHAVDIFDELVSIPQLIAHPRFALEVVLARIEEVRRPDAARGWRRRGWVVDHRRLIEVIDRVHVGGVEDLVTLMPSGLPEPFTSADLAARLGRSRPMAQRMTYCLAKAGAITPVGRSGNTVRWAHAPLDTARALRVRVDPGPGSPGA